MTFELLHNGKNIVNSIKISKCYSFDRFGGTIDDLVIAFATKDHTIEFYENDIIEIRTAGGFTTGEMYLDSCVGRDGEFVIKALSCRHKNKKKRSKIWHRPKLSKIIGDVASNLGLTPLLYGITDYSYESVSQVSEHDLKLLSRICKREGYSIKCDNGNLIVFNEHYIENNSTPIQITRESVKSDYSFSRSADCLSSMTVRYFDITTRKTISATATDSNISGGEDVSIEFVSDYTEAQRFSNGYLREANKLYIHGILEMPFNENISAGTVCDLTGFEEFDGLYVVYEARQDFVNSKTALKVRKLLNY